jgi:hypothetical protein
MSAFFRFKSISIAIFITYALPAFCSRAFAVTSPEKEVLVSSVPKWNIGDTWKYHTNKQLDRMVTQNLGMMQMTMRLNKVETTSSYVVTGAEAIDGEECYTVKINGEQKITGNYNTTPVQGEAMGGELSQNSTFEGFEYRRVSDLAFVKTLVKAKGAIEIGGILQGIPVPFETDSITTSNPPIKQFSFPLVKDDAWHVSSVVTTTTSGASTDTVTITYSYECRVKGKGTVTTANGRQYEAVVIQQNGTQTTQSQNSGVSIDSIDGKLYFAPSVGNTVLDEAEGQELLEYIPAASSAENQEGSPAKLPSKREIEN